MSITRQVPARQDYDARAGETVSKPRTFRMIVPRSDPESLSHGEPAFKTRDVDKGRAYRIQQTTPAPQQQAQDRADRAEQDARLLEESLQKAGYYNMNPYEQLEYWMLRKPSMRTQENIDILARYYASKEFWEREFYPQYAGVYDPIKYDPKTQKLWSAYETDQGLQAIIVPREYTGEKIAPRPSLTEQFLGWMPKPVDPLQRMLYERGIRSPDPTLELAKAIFIQPIAITEQVASIFVHTPAPVSGSALIAQTILGNKQAENILAQYPAYAVSNLFAEALTLAIVTQGAQIAGSYAMRGASSLASRISTSTRALITSRIGGYETETLERATGLTPTKSYWIARTFGQTEPTSPIFTMGHELKAELAMRVSGFTTPIISAGSAIKGAIAQPWMYAKSVVLPNLNKPSLTIPFSDEINALKDVLGEPYYYAKNVWLANIHAPSLPRIPHVPTFQEIKWFVEITKARAQYSIGTGISNVRASMPTSSTITQSISQATQQILFPHQTMIKEEIALAKFSTWFALPAPTTPIARQDQQIRQAVKTEKAYQLQMPAQRQFTVMEMLPAPYQEQAQKGERTMMHQWLGVAFPFLTATRARSVEMEIQSLRTPYDPLTVTREVGISLTPSAYLVETPESALALDVSARTAMRQDQGLRVMTQQIQRQAQKLAQEQEQIPRGLQIGISKRRKRKKGEPSYIGWQKIRYPMKTGLELLGIEQ